MRRFCKNILFPVIIGVMVLCLSLFVLVGCGGNKTNTPVRRPDTSAGTGNTAPSDATPAPQTAAPAKEQPVTVTFYDGDVLYATAAADADGVILPTAPTKEGYVFDGWFTDRDTLRIAFTPSVRITADSTVYAKWHAVEENNGENSGENGNSGENQGENGNSGENQGENQGENNGENGENNDNENPEDPNQEDPNQGGQEAPQPKQLDFSGLEAKLVEVILANHRGASLNALISYSINNGKMYICYDIQGSVRSGIYLKELTKEIEVLDTQEKINGFSDSLTKSDLSKDSLVSLTKTGNDIVIDDQTYSKDGIEGDNPFARQCGVENAWMTYVSDFAVQVFSGFDTGYARIVKIATFSIDKNNEITADVFKVAVESNHEYTNDQLYRNLLTEGKSVIREHTEFNVGQNLKSSKVAEASEET